MKKKEKKNLEMIQKNLKNYTNFFEKKNLAELTIEEKGIKTTLKIKGFLSNKASPSPIPPPSSSLPLSKTREKKTNTSNYKKITSPIIGTFYSSPTPEKPPFVKVGDKVTPQTKIGIIEAMKNMNEIKAMMSGKIVEILVENQTPVQAGSVLMHLE